MSIQPGHGDEGPTRVHGIGLPSRSEVSLGQAREMEGGSSGCCRKTRGVAHRGLVVDPFGDHASLTAPRVWVGRPRNRGGGLWGRLFGSGSWSASKKALGPFGGFCPPACRRGARRISLLLSSGQPFQLLPRCNRPGCRADRGSRGALGPREEGRSLAPASVN